MKKGVTLVEMLVVVLIFAFLFGAILTILAISDRSWRIGQAKLAEQQEARRAMDNIGRLLRQSSPDVVEGEPPNEIHHYVTITDNNQRIDFYQPIFDTMGGFLPPKKITFKLNPNDSRQLLKNVGEIVNPVVVATHIESINFGGGCAACAAFNCSPVAVDCPVVMIEVKTKKEKVFTLSSQITLRNGKITLGAGTGIEEPGEGEF